MSKTILRIPIQLDLMYLKSEDSSMMNPIADFSGLSYVDGEYNTVPDTPLPFVGESVLSQPFEQGETHSLKAGLHLHWALPDALTVGRGQDGKTTFPAVPNRWLIRRSSGGKVQKQWIVESDYCYPLDNNKQPTQPDDNSSINFPIHTTGTEAPFRYMGRVTPIESSTPFTPGSAEEYLSHYDLSLTAVGYGDPFFAALYPNCHSVFGFCDTDFGPATFRNQNPLDAQDIFEYEVLGWYAEYNNNSLSKDALHLFDLNNTIKTPEDQFNALETEFNWKVSQDQKANGFPTKSIYYCKRTVVPNNVAKKTPNVAQASVSIGNTGTEALSAYLAAEMSKDEATQNIIENQLEALALNAQLDSQHIDLEPKFLEAKHSQGFTAVESGILWTLVPIKEKSVPGQQGISEPQSKEQVTLPDSLAHLLNGLNIAQQNYDEAIHEIDSLRFQLYTDWHKYMMDKYAQNPYLENRGFNVIDYINDVSLPRVSLKIKATGSLEWLADPSDSNRSGSLKSAAGKNTITLDLSAPYTLGGKIPAKPVVLSEAIIAKLDALLTEVNQKQLSAKFRLVRKSAPRYWQPNDPVLLLEGDIVQETTRYGQGGGLLCELLTGSFPKVTTSLNQATLKKIFSTFQAKTGDADYDLAVKTQNTPPWHPILFEWQAQIKEGAQFTNERVAFIESGDTLWKDYKPSYITNNYELKLNACTLNQKNPDPTGSGHYSQYKGRSVLTPHANSQVQHNIAQYLEGLTLLHLADKQLIPKPSDEVAYLIRLENWFAIRHKINNKPDNTASLSSLREWCGRQFPFRQAEGDGFSLLAWNYKDSNTSKTLVDWYNECPIYIEGKSKATVGNIGANDSNSDPIYTSIQAYNILRQPSAKILSQSLSGFNAALLRRSQTMQIPIFDPLASNALGGKDSPEYKLNAQVAKVVGNTNRYSPLDHGKFQPVRRGDAYIEQLQMIDTFGQIASLPQTNSTYIKLKAAPKYLNLGPAGKNIVLPARLTQPARVQFRWLAAQSGFGDIDEMEMNDHAASTPICGWFIPNNLDNSLMVYSTEGIALGSINQNAVWESTPGVNMQLQWFQIPNEHLRKVVQYLCVHDGEEDAIAVTKQAYLQTFISTVEDALETIDPQDYAQHQSLALLMGRPIAVVRATLDLQVEGRLATDLSWNAFIYQFGEPYGYTPKQVTNPNSSLDFALLKGFDPSNQKRITDSFEKVKFPLRIGEKHQLNDGLVGLWVEDEQGRLSDTFFAPEQNEGGPQINNPIGNNPDLPRNIKTAEASNIPPISIQDDPLKMTLLLDPRGTVHATTGILPTKVLSIPPDQYAEVLKSMAITFLTSPILTDPEQIHLPLPKEAGYEWSWITRPDGFKWKETGSIKGTNTHAKVQYATKIVEGWLKLSPTDK